MTFGRRPAALALVAGALLTSGCGSDDEGDPIPASSVQDMERQLDAISSRLANPTPDECSAVESESLPALQSSLESLPKGVDAGVRDALEESFAHLQELVTQACTDVETETETEETETTPPPETETVPPETETQPETETTPPETETTPTPPNTNTQPDNDTGGAQGGAGQGGGTPANPGQGND